jgi:hypothetical protein
MRIRTFNHPAMSPAAVLALAAVIAVTSPAIGADTGATTHAARAAGKPKHYALSPKAPVTGTATISRTVPKGKRFLLYDAIFQNPSHDIGRVRLLRGGTTLLSLNLQDFHTEQHSLQAPIAFGHATKVKFFIDCDNPSGGCTPALLLAGKLKG